ncbi:MAG TPA: prephenate dehydratase [Acidobacteriaceae bacterium]|nr:prephenate dehydratase [Acidobacteriaceae bacterium]
MKIAIQGELGSFSHEAAVTFVSDATVVPCAVAADVLHALDESQVEAAAIPVENSLAGSVIDFYDLFFSHEFAIERELQMRIRHNLIVTPGTEMESLRQVFSHPVALAQCKEFFAAHPILKPTAYYDTAGSVQHILEEKSDQLAAIASRQAAAQYGAKILEEGIEDRAGSFTRFWLIRPRGAVRPEANPSKLSIAFSLENRPGALLQALGTFAARKLNLTKIESRPINGRPWEYMFYADVTISSSDQASAVLDDLRKICPALKEMGRYSTGNRASN